MDRVVFEAHRGQLGKELVGQAGVDEEPQPGCGVIDHHQLVEFVTKSLGRHDLEPWRHLSDRLDQFGGRRELVSGDEPGGAQHPQRIVTEADLGTDRRAQHTGRQVDGSVERVDQLGGAVVAGQLERHGVHREVTP